METVQQNDRFTLFLVNSTLSFIFDNNLGSMLDICMHNVYLHFTGCPNKHERELSGDFYLVFVPYGIIRKHNFVVSQ